MFDPVCRFELPNTGTSEEEAPKEFEAVTVLVCESMLKPDGAVELPKGPPAETAVKLPNELEIV